MIRINLLPQELRKRDANATRIPYVPLAILAGVLFLLLTFFFYGDYLKARSTYKSVQKEWAKVNPLMAELKALETRVDGEMKGEKDFLEKNILNTDSMTSILVWVSEFLPSRGWLTELRAQREGQGFRVALKGVVLPSRKQTSIEQIEEYFQNLKAKFPPQTTVSLTTTKDAQDKEKTEGTAFAANLEWGVTRK